VGILAQRLDVLGLRSSTTRAPEQCILPDFLDENGKSERISGVAAVYGLLVALALSAPLAAVVGLSVAFQLGGLHEKLEDTWPASWFGPPAPIGVDRLTDLTRVLRLSDGLRILCDCLSWVKTECGRNVFRSGSPCVMRTG
jgi:hypothetical protein